MLVDEPIEERNNCQNIQVSIVQKKKKPSYKDLDYSLEKIK
jgi:hypothetical protein